MKKPLTPPRATAGAPFKEDAALVLVDAPEDDEAVAVPVEVPEVEDEEESSLEGEGVLTASLARTLSSTLLISLPL